MLAALVALVLACGGDDGPTGSGDKTPPTLNSTSPADNAVGIPVDASVSATFSEAIASASISTQSFSLTPAGGSAVAGTFSTSGTTITFRPTVDLTYQTVHTARLTTAITDLAGNHLAAEYSWSFTTQIDPNTLPAQITDTDPDSNTVDVEVDKVITATFSKGMDASTITTSSAQLRDSTGAAVPSTVTYTPATRTVSITPDDSLDYDARYTVTLGTAILDTFGVALASDYTWPFVTELDPETPTLSMTWPKNDAILDDTVTLEVDITAFAAVDSVVYFRGATRIDVSTVNPYSLSWNVSGMVIGDPYSLSARVYDALGRMGASQPLTVYYQWELVGIDINDPWPTDLRRVFARTTNDHLMIRVQTSEPWNSYPYPYDTIIGNDTLVFLDTSFATAIYLDSDRNPLTGRHDFAQINLNGIGADHRILIGFFGGDTTLSHWAVSVDTSLWELDYDTTGLAYHDVPPDSNIFIIAIAWSDLDNAQGVDMVVLNANLDLNSPGTTPVTDFIPVLGGGAINIERADRWLGDGFGKSALRHRPPSPSLRPVKPVQMPNPF